VLRGQLQAASLRLDVHRNVRQPARGGDKAMDYIFWTGIIIGALLGFFISVTANLATPSFQAYFSKSKAGWIERSKKRALSQFIFVMRFRTGTEDKYMYFVAQWSYIILLIIIAFVLLGTNRSRFHDSVLGLCSIACITYGSWTHQKLKLWYWRMNNFEEYKSALLKRYPDLELD
jgi:hypothetical protein